MTYGVNSCPYNFLVLGTRTYFYITSIFGYFSRSKIMITIVRNKKYFCTSGNTYKIVLALSKGLQKVWQVSKATPRQNRSRRSTTTYICTCRFKIIFVRKKVRFSSQAPRNLLFYGQKNYFETPRTNIRSSIPPRTVFSSSDLLCFAK